MKRYLPVLIIAILVLGCNSNKKQDSTSINETENKPATVSVEEINKQLSAHNVSYSTTLEGYEQVNLAPSVMGRISRIFVDVGDNVTKGENLFTMDENQYNTAKLNYTNLKTEMERVEQLIKSGSISQQIYDQTKLQLEQMEENLKFLEQNTFVKAPFSGVISAKNYEENEIFANMPVLILTQINVLKALVNVPESYYPLVKRGMNVEIISNLYPNDIFNGTVEIVYPTIDPITHTFKMKIKIPNNGNKLRPGMYTNVNMALGEIQTVIVPYQSVLKVQGSNDRYIFINDNGVAKRINVTLGQRFDDKIEIFANEDLQGLSLVVEGQAKLLEGTKLIVK
jgi:membrane fusion protein (multidrug efflux system)